MGKFLLTCSIVILFILFQTGELVSSRGGRTHRRNSRPVNKPDNSRRSNASPSARDRSPNSPIFREPGNHPRSSSNRKNRENLLPYLDNLYVVPLRDTLKKPRDHPQSLVKPKNPESSSHQNPQLGENNRKPKRRKSKDKIEAASEFPEATKDHYTFSRSSEGGSSRPHDGNTADSKPKGNEVKYVVGRTVTNAPVEDPESYILGSPIAKMDFRFNDSEEERWWNENRHRFATHVYHPNSSQPISRDVFMSECVNVTVGEYVKPTGNQTEDELEARVVTHVANVKCMEMYPCLTDLTTAGSYYNNKPEGATILEIKSEFKHGEGAILANSLGRASGHNPQNNAVSDLHFSFENALFLIHPFAISVITLITPLLIF